MILGWLYDGTGSYNIPFHVAGTMVAISGAMLYAIPFVQKCLGRKPPTDEIEISAPQEEEMKPLSAWTNDHLIKFEKSLQSADIGFQRADIGDMQCYIYIPTIPCHWLSRHLIKWNRRNYMQPSYFPALKQKCMHVLSSSMLGTGFDTLYEDIVGFIMGN